MALILETLVCKLTLSLVNCVILKKNHVVHKKDCDKAVLWMKLSVDKPIPSFHKVKKKRVQHVTARVSYCTLLTQAAW